MNRCGHMDDPDGNALATRFTRDGFPHVGFVQWWIPFLGVGRKTDRLSSLRSVLHMTSTYQLHYNEGAHSAHCEPSNHDDDLSWHLS